MSDITFNQISANIRTPGTYGEFNTATASRTLTGNPQTVLLLGQRLSAGTYKGVEPVQVYSDEEAATLFGRGSQAHLMAQAAIVANNYLQVSVLPLSDDAGAGIAATATLTFTGPSTGTGQNSVWIMGVRIDVAVANAADMTSMGVKLAAAINANKNLPATATAAAGVITLTARNKGTFGNEIGLRVATTVPGVTLTAAAGTVGAGDPDIAPALAAVYGAGFNILACPYSSDVALTAMRTFLDAVSGPMEQRSAIATAGWRGTLATATTLATDLDEGRITLAWHNGSQLPNSLIAAAYAAVIASQDDPARPFDDLPIVGLDVTPLSAQAGGTEIENALWNGVTPLKIGPGNRVQIVRAISTYTTSANGAADPSLLDITTIRSLDYTRLAIDNRIELRFPQQKNVPRVAKAVRSEIINVLYSLQDMEIVENVDLYKDGIDVQTSTQDSGRLNAVKPFGITNIRIAATAPLTSAKTSIEPGMTAWEALTQAAEASGLWPWTDPDGTLVIGGPDYTTPPVGTLVMRHDGKGNNILDIDMDKSIARRYSQTTVLAQQHGSEDEDGQNAMRATVSDPQITLYRPKIIIAHDAQSQQEVEFRARKAQADARLAGFTMTVSVKGLRAPNGKPWTPGQRVHVVSEPHGIDAIFFLMKRSFNGGAMGMGEKATLTLKEDGVWIPDAYLIYCFMAFHTVLNHPITICFKSLNCSIAFYSVSYSFVKSGAWIGA